MHRIGIDIGGTFTDFAVWRGNDDGFDRILSHKEPSTPPNFARAVCEGLERLLPRLAIADPRDVLVVHGMTVGTNAIIERSGPKLALLTTAGFRDILELGRLRMPNPTDLFNRRPRPLISREWVIEIAERLRADGAVQMVLDEAAVAAAARRCHDAGITAMVVCFLHSWRDAAHERRAREAIIAAVPEMDVVLSCDVWPQQSEYERATLAVLNAYVKPVMSAYLAELEVWLAQRLPGARLLISRSNGGTMSAEEARRLPVHTLLSGPAAGVTATRHLGTLVGRANLLTMDMGGTSTDMSLVRDGRTMTSTLAEVGDFPLLMPVTAVEAMGAGGGSLIRLDGEVLRVGPRSAGARPGPACYGRGGIEPTLSDAYLLCGLLGDSLLGGRLRLDRGLAETALAPVARVLGVGVAEAASHCVDVATASMLARVLPFLARLGVDPEQLTLVLFGGAGAVHGPLLAAELGIANILIPPAPSVFCAAGCVVSDIVHDATLSMLGSSFPLQAGLAALEEETRQWLAAQIDPALLTGWEFEPVAGMRYRGQAFHIDVPLPRGATPELAVMAFHDEHLRCYGHADSGAAVEFVELRTRVTGSLPAPGYGARPPTEAAFGVATSRRIMLGGRWIDAVPVRPRAALGPREMQAGPAILEQGDATIFVPPGFTASLGAIGTLVMERL